MNVDKNIAELQKGIVIQDRMGIHFEYYKLPEGQKAIGMQFYNLADQIVQEIKAGPERTVALRKLLEARDSAFRAITHPGG